MRLFYSLSLLNLILVAFCPLTLFLSLCEMHYIIFFIFLFMFIHYLFQHKNGRLTDRTNQLFSCLFCVIAGCCMCIYTYHIISWTMLVFRYSSKKRRKGFANHFVLLLQFHESRNAAERKKQGVRGGGGERAEKIGRERLWVALVGPGSTVTYSNSTGLDGIT